MVNPSLQVLVKVAIASGLISVGIKFLGPQLGIPATPLVALSFVLLPTLLMGLALGIQHQLQSR